MHLGYQTLNVIDRYDVISFHEILNNRKRKFTSLNCVYNSIFQQVDFDL